ncbi:Serine--pyruvate aminotransferase, mitochondrial [Halotydeus destructor]|nr:Serine--pyruvate aminotransferase, mitochondrial [Halotydeus destructor]
MANQTGRRIVIEPPPLRPLKGYASGKLLLGPGPTNVAQRVADASQPMISHGDPSSFKLLLKETKLGLRYVFQTRNEFTFAITSSGTGAMEATVANILEDGDVFLVAVHGLWGQRAVDMGKAHGAKVVQLHAPTFGAVIDGKQFEEALARHRPKLMYVCHGDSTTGTLQPLEGLGAMCRKYNCLLMVDAIASLLSAPVPMDDLGIDVLLTASQKALNVQPGLAPISFSDGAIQVIQQRKSPLKTYYFDIMKIADNWQCNGKAYFHHTQAISLIKALHESLVMITEASSLEAIISHQNEVSHYLQSKLEQLGLVLLVKKAQHRLPSVIVVQVPEAIDGHKVQLKLLADHGIEIAGGLGGLPPKGQIWRIGLMGASATRANCDALLAALKSVLVPTSKL